MNHKGCGGPIQLKLDGMFTIKSPSINITPTGITPGMIEITSSGKRISNIFMCAECREEFTTKAEIEDNITCTCVVCQGEFKPSEIKVTPYIPFICSSCITNDNTKNVTSGGSRLLSLYQMALKSSSDFPTLLTVLLKK